MKLSLITMLALMTLAATGPARATPVLDMKLDGYVANAEATMAACKKIAPVGSMRLGVAIARAVKSEKQTIEALRKTPGYAKEFKREADRWHYMSESNRTTACRKLNDVQYP